MVLRKWLWFYLWIYLSGLRVQ